jgi:hypothetical protein
LKNEFFLYKQGNDKHPATGDNTKNINIHTDVYETLVTLGSMNMDNDTNNKDTHYPREDKSGDVEKRSASGFPNNDNTPVFRHARE